MRLVTYLPPGRLPTGSAGAPDRPSAGPRLGVLHRGLVVDPVRTLVAEAASSTGGVPDALPPHEMVAFFQGGTGARALAERALEIADAAAERGDELADADGPTVHREDAVRLLAPVPRPRRIRDYLTYRDHAAGSGMDVPEAMAAMPICYKANVETVVGPGEPLLWPSYTRQLDFELEIGFFTGGGGRDLSPAQAAPLVAGVTIFNDVSARDVQFYEMSLNIGPSKGKDFCTAMGPCVVTMDEVDELAIEMTARVNGEVWARGTSGNRFFSFAEVLAWASLDEPVHPGEFLAVGTIGGGCGLELDRWIAPGDVVELEASGVGVLRNPVAQPSTAPPGAGLASYRGSPPVHVQHA